MGKKEKPRRRRREEEGGIQSEMKIERAREGGRKKYETLRKRLIIFSGLSKHKNKEDENNKAGKYLGGKT